MIPQRLYPSRFSPFSLCLILFALLSAANERCAAAQSFAELASAEGKVEGLVAPSKAWSSIASGQQFALHDGVRTLDQSRAGVRFSTGYLVRMNEKTTITFDQAPAETKGRISVLEGMGHFFSRKPQEAPSIQTPHISASVRGTEFVVEVANDRTVVSVLDGAVDAENQFGSVSLGKGEQAIARAGSAPVKQILVRPIDTVQWALYYPAVLDLQDFADVEAAASSDERLGLRALERGDFAVASNAFSANSWVSTFGRAVTLYRAGKGSEALAMLRSSSERPAGSHLLEAALLLSVGQVEAASNALGAAESRLSSTSDARLRAATLSERAVIAVVKQNIPDAEQMASRAIELAPDSAAAHLALSFVRQSQFRLDEALALLERTIALSPESGVARARLAELLLGFGDRESAVRVAQEALARDPGNAYARTVLGFADLVELNTDQAIENFSDALRIDSAFALAKLGMGLAEIRRGDLAAGRRDLEMAAELDPAVALYRSYLGKAYYEEEREDLSIHEYQRAIDLDPNDPTPYLYRAYAKLATHRPIEALEDVQESIERNDNRAVFRSRLLLDQDQGTRSSGLGQIYSRLGFNDLARVEAVRALNRDYTNYSAHFLLADLYNNTQLNSRAQVTENLLGRLLSPVSFNANDLNIGGEASLNEYNTLFDRPVDRARVTVLGDSQRNAFGGRASYTFNTGTLAMNVGYDGLSSQGFRDNDFFRTNQLFSLGQYGLTADDTLVWDAALTSSDQGDINVNFNPRQEDPDFESDFDGALVRGGYHRRIGPGLHFVTQAFYNYGDFDGQNLANNQRLSFLQVSENGMPVTGEPFFFDAKTDEHTGVKQHLGRADAQLLWDTDLVSVVAGTSASVEHLDGDERSTISDPGSEPLLGFLQGREVFSRTADDEVTSQTFTYSTWHATRWLDLDAGLTYSWLRYQDNNFRTPFTDDTYTKDQFGPKAGAVVALNDTASLRFVYSRSLDRTGRGGLGPLEPTFVGGFNQVFDGVRGSSQDLYGAGLDLKFGKKTFAGLSYQRREIDLDVPIVNGGIDYDRGSQQATAVESVERLTGNANVDRVSTYGYQILGSRFAAVLDYQFERFDENDPFPETQTNRASAGLNYFDPTGFFGYGRATYRYQERAGIEDPKTINDFWMLGAGIGYELDHHGGAVTLGFDNLLDQEFEYSAIADEDPVLPRFGAQLNLSLSF
ncbi:MAG: FecR domain-containing protein [Bdellovibrionota bacterium]